MGMPQWRARLYGSMPDLPDLTWGEFERGAALAQEGHSSSAEPPVSEG
jgi:hypothetical protein